MATLNSNYNKIVSRYLFGEIGKRTTAYKLLNPKVDIIRLGIGDTTQELVPEVVNAMQEAIFRLSKKESYTGYADRGADSDVLLRQEIVKYYESLGVNLSIDEIIISDGAKGDCASIHQVFPNSIIAVQDPSYPVYVDSSVLYGQTGLANKNGEYQNMVYLRADASTGFVCQIPTQKVDLIYLCFPNNPTGAVATREQLQAFVDYAIANKAIIIYDAAYSWFISDPAFPQSIYEIEGAKQCAIELNSFSKFAGFTGIRVGWSVASKELVCEGSDYGEINKAWVRRSDTHFNGASVISQYGAIAALQNRDKCQKTIDFYMENARLIKTRLESANFVCFGGENAPYIWLQTPTIEGKRLTSWQFFDLLLNECQVIGTPGSGFGPSGEGYFRLSAFGNRENTIKALDRITTRFA